MQNKKIKADNYFAIIPEWVLYSDISANAVRLYCVLRRYADGDGKCHPSRATLSLQARISSPTLSKAVDELVAIGALAVRHRRSPSGDFTSNQYTVITTRPEVVKNIDPPCEVSYPTGGKEPSPQTKAISNQSQEPDGATDVARQIAKRWWDSLQVKPLGKRAWFVLNKVVGEAVEKGYAEEQIINALNDAGSVPSMAEMDKRLRGVYKSKRQQQFRQAKQDLQELTTTNNLWELGE